MKIINAGFEIENIEVFKGMLERIEKVGRTCYKSENNITTESAPKFVEMIIKRGHEAMIEHGGMISVRFICDRGASHELVRHRIASFAQESTRYCGYQKDKFGNELTCISIESMMNERIETIGCERIVDILSEHAQAMIDAEKHYMRMIELGCTPQEARSVLPNSLKTEIVVSANPREWRAFFKLRVEDAAHPQMREVTRPLLDKLKELVPVLFDDITY